MSTNDREKVHFELLEALYTARKQVEALEASLAHNAAFLGTGVEREGQIGQDAPAPAMQPNSLMRYLELVEPGEDISNYIGREGDEESRPRLGKDAPEEVRPDKEPEVSPLVGLLALGHSADDINFGLLRVPTGNDTLDVPAQTDSLELAEPAGVAAADLPDGLAYSTAADVQPESTATGAAETEALPDGLALDTDDSERVHLIFKAINDGIWD